MGYFGFYLEYCSGVWFTWGIVLIVLYWAGYGFNGVK